jgi:DNA polymerase/3'-5' exonuclease PolX
MNSQIIDILTRLANHYKKDINLKFKYNAINKALVAIKSYPKKITSGDDARKNIPNIGEGIAKRIDEILATGGLLELKGVGSYGESELHKITGIGDAKIKQLESIGIRSIDELRKAVKKGDVNITHSVAMGLLYYEDMEKRIPRKEIDQYNKILEKELLSIDKNFIFNICGSYRRGAKDSGDIDVLITVKNSVDNGDRKYLKEYVELLKKKGIIIDDLTNKGDKKYMGFCKLGYGFAVRRIDIRYIEYQSYYTALIYFTGSKEFNISIRKIALSKGYSLSEYGLKKKDGNGVIVLDSEEELFEILGIKYVEPKDRS